MTELRWDTLPLRGQQLVEASAGTGKTYTITTMVLRLLLERRLRLEQILVVTFTNAAAAELRERVRRRLRHAGAAFAPGGATEDRELSTLVAASRDSVRDRALLLAALRGLDEAPIHTIHGFCSRVLAEQGLASGARFSPEAVAEVDVLLTRGVADFWAREVATASLAEVRYLRRRAPFAELVSLARRAVARPELMIQPAEASAELKTEAALAHLAEAAAAARVEWEASGDAVLALLAGHPGLSRSRYRPDSIRGWAASMELLLAGEPPVEQRHLEVCLRFTPASLRAGTRKGQSPPEHPFFALVAEVLDAEAAAEGALEAWLVGLQRRLVAWVRQAIPAEQRRAGVVGYDDLLLGVRDALAGPGGDGLAARLRARFPAALIDEFQDTDPVQYAIFAAIYAHPAATALYIGDPKQAIYSFRGADVFAYLTAVRDTAGEPHTLATSYRSDPRLVAATNHLFTRCERPFLLEAIRYVPVSPRPGATERLRVPEPAPAALELAVVGVPAAGEERARGGDARALLVAAAAEVRRWLDCGATIDGAPLGAADVAVLTRSNREAEQVQLELAALGVPSVLYGDRSVLDTPEAFEVACVLAALAEPASGRRVRAALATPLVGLGGSGLAALANDEDGWELWLERFSRWHERWSAHGFIHAFRGLLREVEVVPRLLGEPRGERRLTNVLHLGELLQEASTAHHLGPAALVRWFARVRSDAAARDAAAAEAMQVRLESDADAVRVVTMHRSKGLEYPVVVCPSLGRSTSVTGGRRRLVSFHDPAAGHAPTLCLGGEGREAAASLAAEEALAEGLRLAYVAVTRARHAVTVVMPLPERIGGSPLEVLLSGRHDDRAEAAPRAPRPSPAAQVGALAARIGSDPDTLRVRPAVAAVDGPPFAPARSLPAITVLTPTRRFVNVRRVASYSALVARALAGAEPEGPDHDELTEAVEPVEASPPAAEGAGVVDAPPPARVPLADFPRGPEPGNALHAVLERVDFATFDAAVARPLIDAELERHGISSELHGEVVAQALAGAIDTPLDAAGLRLRDLAVGEVRCEVEFTLPVRSMGEDARVRPLDAASLARVLAAEGGEALPPGYAERVARLGFNGLTGHLRGFIDLVFSHQGRFYVADYKSNYLGDRCGDYAPPALAAAMAEHHYFLQAYLYTVALHRHLGACRPDYVYERDFGGIYYLFLRGMGPESGPRAGVHFERPSQALVEGLSSTLGGLVAGVHS